MWTKLALTLGLLVVFLILSHRVFTSPSWKRYQLKRASLMAAKGQIKRMLKYLERNRNRSSVSDPLTNALVYFLIKSGSLDKAEEVVLEAIERGDGTGQALAQLGYIASGRNEPGAAEEYYRRAIEKDQSLKSSLNVNIAAILIDTGERLEDAEALLEEAIELREGSAGGSGAHINLALLHMKRGEFREALVRALTGYELIPAAEITKRSRANALAIAARAYKSMGEDDEASRMASKGLKLLDDAPEDDRLTKELRLILDG